MNRKKTCRNSSAAIEIEDFDGDMEDPSSISENFESAIEDQDKRNSRVNQLLNKITDAGDGLADFVPVAAPKSTLADLLPTITNKPEGFESSLLERAAANRDNHGEYAPNNFGEERLGNYSKMYEPPSANGVLGKPYYASMGIGSGTPTGSALGDNSVMQKLNYITHILEDIQMEKTSNITEELILYSFLGVFVIFVVDSFAKAGKYYR
jgi:hypothetical protein